MLACACCSLGFTDGDHKVGRIDPQQQIALVDELIVSDRQLDDAPRDLRRHRDDIGAHGGVARPRRPHVGVPHGAAEQHSQRDGRERDQERNESFATRGGLMECGLE
jgi:hypothetical protein